VKNLDRKGSFSSASSGQSNQAETMEDSGFRPSDFAKVYCKGYLSKKNEVLSNGKVPNRNWLTYWVVLRSHYLMFYKERKHYTAQKEPIGGLSIKGAEITPIFDYKKREHVFRLKTSKGASYLMEAESLEEMTAWLTYIEQAAKLAAEEEQKWLASEGKTQPDQKPDLTHDSFDEGTHGKSEDGGLSNKDDDDSKPDISIKLSPQEEKALEEEERKIEMERLQRAGDEN